MLSLRAVLLALIVLATAGFVTGTTTGALDVREAFHQSGESRPGLLALAVLVAMLHSAAAAVVLMLGRGGTVSSAATVASVGLGHRQT
jgi:hypothetical protein